MIDKNVIAQKLGELLAFGEIEAIHCLSFCNANAYIAIRSDPRLSTIRIIVSANGTDSEKLSVENQQWLYDKAYRRKRASEDFEKTLAIEECIVDELAPFVEAAFTTCFGTVVEKTQLISVPVFEFDDQSVLDSMMNLSRQRDWSARKTLYRILIDTSFILPVLAGKPQVEGKMGSWPVCAAFTSEEAFFNHHPLGTTCTHVMGKELFSDLVDGRFGSLRINPSNSICGELYFNELEMLKDAAQKISTYYEGRRSQ